MTTHFKNKVYRVIISDARNMSISELLKCLERVENRIDDLQRFKTPSGFIRRSLEELSVQAQEIAAALDTRG